MARAPQTQATFNATPRGLNSLEKQIRAVFEKALARQQNRIEKLGEAAAIDIVGALARRGGGVVYVAGKPIAVKAIKDFDQTELRRILSDTDIIGQIGIPHPDDALEELRKTISLAVTARTRVFKDKISIAARFYPERLIPLNPHPAKRMPNGQKIEVQSWLQWTVGPKFERFGTPGFGFASIDQIVKHLAVGSENRQRKVGSLINAPRTSVIAGSNAGLMFSLQSKGAGIGQYEYWTGVTGKDWKPIPLATNFWDGWWKSNAMPMKTAFVAAAQAIVNMVARQETSR